MKTPFRSILYSLSLVLVLPFTSCEKQEDPIPCQTVDNASCILDGLQHYNLIEESNVYSKALGGFCITYQLGANGNKLAIQFLKHTTATDLNHSLTTQGKEIAFTVFYDGNVYKCDSASGTEGTYAGVYTNYDDWSRSFNFNAIDVATGKKIQVYGSFSHYKTGNCHEGNGWDFSFDI